MEFIIIQRSKARRIHIIVMTAEAQQQQWQQSSNWSSIAHTFIGGTPPTAQGQSDLSGNRASYASSPQRPALGRHHPIAAQQGTFLLELTSDNAPPPMIFTWPEH
jgi:hypothetical protein